MNVNDQIQEFFENTEEKTIIVIENFNNKEFGTETSEKISFLMKKFLVGTIELKEQTNALYMICQSNKVRTYTNILEAKVEGNTLFLTLLDTPKITSKIEITKEV